MTYIIYKVTNLINGKVYIGKTNNFEKRKREHTLYNVEDNCYFHKALKKYGLDNFEWTIIDGAETKEEITALEKHYIKTYNSYKPNGYNLTLGGDGGSMWNAKPVVMLDLQGRYIKEYVSAGQAQTEDGYLSDKVVLCCKGKRRQHKGRQFMYKDEYEALGGKQYTQPPKTEGKAVVQLSLQGDVICVFDSVADASRETETQRTSILGVLSGTYKSANGFFWMYADEHEKQNTVEVPRKIEKGTPIYQIDVKTNKPINKFKSTADAGRQLGVSYKVIWKAVVGQHKTAYGYKWKTVDQYDNTVLT